MTAVQRLPACGIVLLMMLAGAGAGAAPQQQDVAPPSSETGESPQKFTEGIPTAALALYKTMSYTTIVLMTDQFWYMAAASQAVATGGWFGGVNVVTSPMLTYGFEYVWDKCCEAPPNAEGVVPVSAEKALIYRIVSTARVGIVALAFGNSLGSSALVTGAIAVTRTGVYAVNDYVWGHIDRRSPAQVPAPPVSKPQLARNNSSDPADQMGR